MQVVVKRKKIKADAVALIERELERCPMTKDLEDWLKSLIGEKPKGNRRAA